MQKEIEKDPTLKTWWSNKIEYKHINHQVELKICVLKIALNRFLDKKIKDAIHTPK